MSERKLRVFLCHASQDKPIVRELYKRLNAEGWVDPWLDKEKLLPGQDWRTEIEQAVDASDIVVICLSNNSVDKEGFIQKELRYAREIALEKPDNTIFLIPLRLDACEVPRGLRFFQWVDYFGENKEQNYKDLLKLLAIRYEQVILRTKGIEHKETNDTATVGIQYEGSIDEKRAWSVEQENSKNDNGVSIKQKKTVLPKRVTKVLTEKRKRSRKPSNKRIDGIRSIQKAPAKKIKQSGELPNKKVEEVGSSLNAPVKRRIHTSQGSKSEFRSDNHQLPTHLKERGIGWDIFISVLVIGGQLLCGLLPFFIFR